MKSGIVPIKYKDHRTYDFHRTFGSTTTAPERFSFDTLAATPDQNKDGLPEACTAYTHNDIASNEDATLYDDYDFTYRNTLRMMDVAYGSPCDITAALKATTVYGIKNKQETPTDALQHRRGPYFIVRPLNGDYFDGLVSAMWTKQGCLSLATPWYKDFEAPSLGIPPSPTNWSLIASWHDWEATGVEVIGGSRYIVGKSWQGNQFGKNGYLYFSRKQMNQLLSTTGAGAFGQKHASPEDIKSVEMNIIETAISFCRMLIQKLLNESEPMQTIEPSTYLWDTPDNVRHSIRVLCDETGLNLTDKNIITACIKQESGFNPKAIGAPNTNGTTDYGLCQYNNGHNRLGVPFWIGPGATFASIEEVLNDPEKNVRVMINALQHGRLHLWSSYSTGAYKKHL